MGVSPPLITPALGEIGNTWMDEAESKLRNVPRALPLHRLPFDAEMSDDLHGNGYLPAVGAPKRKKTPIVTTYRCMHPFENCVSPSAFVAPSPAHLDEACGWFR